MTISVNEIAAITIHRAIEIRRKTTINAPTTIINATTRAMTVISNSATITIATVSKCPTRIETPGTQEATTPGIPDETILPTVAAALRAAREAAGIHVRVAAILPDHHEEEDNR